MLMKDLPEDARPREKLLARGAQSLSNAELLALLLRTGLPGKNALQMGQELLDRFGGVAGLLHTDAAALSAIKGMGPAKRAELVAVLELARRALAEQLQQQPHFDSTQATHDYVRLQLGPRPYEVFAVLFLDSQLRLIALEELFRGSLTHTSVYPREVAVRALALGAVNVVLAHNHPSGSAEPSRADIELTQTLKAALSLIDVRVIDHLVVAASGCVSLAERGLI